MDHHVYMNMAYRLALKGRGRTSPNPLVGAVLVKNGRILSVGWHKHCGADHAEVMALKKAGQRSNGASLYVTLEPCCHHGRTPPCVDKIIASGIKTVYVGMIDPNPLVSSRSIKKLRRAGIKVQVGFMRAELELMNEAFIKYIKSRMPFVVAKTAQTLDGKIATASGRSKWITSLKSRQYAKKLRANFDAILVGINTVVQDDPGLNAPSKELKKVVLDTHLKISPKAKLFRKTRPQDCILATTKKADKRKTALFQKKGVNVVVCPVRNGKIDLRWLFHQLAKQEIASVLIEGGGTVIGEALLNRLVDKLHIYIAPKIMGDAKALSSVRGLEAVNVNKLISLKNIKIFSLGEDI